MGTLILCALLAAPADANSRLGASTRGLDLETTNVAAVMAPATLPPFARQASRAGVAVNALGKATSRHGGVLQVTPRSGAEGETYAISRRPLAAGGFTAHGGAERVMQTAPTSACPAAWTLVKREVDNPRVQSESVRIAVRNPDFTTAQRIAQRIDGSLSRVTAPATAVLEVLPSYRGPMATLLTRNGQLRVQPELPARIVIDERSGIIVTEAAVRIGQVAVAQGNLTVRVTETPQVSQPDPLVEGETVVVPRTRVAVEEEGARMGPFEAGVSLQDLTAGLNALGVGPRDLIGILQAIKAAGALQAEIVVM